MKIIYYWLFSKFITW